MAEPIIDQVTKSFLFFLGAGVAIVSVLAVLYTMMGL